ncbi:hypothetical protein BS17DRAFT_821552 [Gyrodon lividus]|nr:hypothetical protein BS17DRAFT_821552 [Gyrodon lividus]
MPNVVNTLLLKLLLGPETFCMTFEPQFPGPLTIAIKPAIIKLSISRPQMYQPLFNRKLVSQAFNLATITQGF